MFRMDFEQSCCQECQPVSVVDCVNNTPALVLVTYTGKLYTRAIVLLLLPHC